MRVVADSNTVVSGLLWHGPPREVLDLAREGKIVLFTTTPLVNELQEVLQRPKFSHRLQLAGVSSQELVFGYAALARVIVPAAIDPVVLDDPDDDAVVACAVAARADYIVSGDSHLLKLEKARGVQILSARKLVTLLTSPAATP